MKKSKLSLGLVTSFIAAMALSACGSDVTKNSTNLVEFTGNNDQPLSVSIDEIYKDYLESSTGISKYYDQVMEVLIRHAFQKDKAGNNVLKGVKRNYNQILDTAKENVESAKETAKQNAESNGTDRKTEWQNILSEKGVKDEEELLQYFIYKLEKEEIEDWYFENHKTELTQEYLGLESNKNTGTSLVPHTSEKATSRYPYHIRHILVKVEEGGSDYVRGTISQDAAKRLSSAVQLLADGRSDTNPNGNTFGEVAYDKSEDSSSSSYGDVGLMTNAISGEKLGMVNEFQLGIYAYDAIVKNGASTRSGDAYNVIDKGLGLDDTVNAYDKDTQTYSDKNVSAALADRGIVEIPYSVFVELGDVAELEANYLTGLTVEDNKTALYPRNLLWNRYLNNHGIFVITNGKRDADYDVSATVPNETRDVKSAASYYTGADAYTKYDGTGTAIDYSKLGGFKANANFVGVNEKVLSDERGNIIIGVRSEFGIHLMIVEKSAYDYAAAVKLEDYYTTYLPKDAEYPSEIPAGEHTYVDFIYSENQNEYKTRVDTIKSAIKSFDSTYDYRLYEQLRTLEGVDQGKNASLFTAINNYIGLQREKNKNEQEDGLEKVWQTYFDLLATQDYYRHTIRDNELKNDRVVPEGCKIAFTTNLTEAQKKQFEEGGHCYVK